MKLKCLLFIIISIFFALFLFSSCSDVDMTESDKGEGGGSAGGDYSLSKSSTQVSKHTEDSIIENSNTRE